MPNCPILRSLRFIYLLGSHAALLGTVNEPTFFRASATAGNGNKGPTDQRAPPLAPLALMSLMSAVFGTEDSGSFRSVGQRTLRLRSHYSQQIQQ
jgi:hypothetical protein